MGAAGWGRELQGLEPPLFLVDPPLFLLPPRAPIEKHFQTPKRSKSCDVTVHVVYTI